jgi:hypothetical protein
MGQRHHLVPRFYLQRWAVPGRGLKAIRRSTGEVMVRNAKTIVEYMLKTQIALDSRDPATMYRRLEDAGLEATDRTWSCFRR